MSEMIEDSIYGKNKVSNFFEDYIISDYDIDEILEKEMKNLVSMGVDNVFLDGVNISKFGQEVNEGSVFYVYDVEFEIRFDFIKSDLFGDKNIKMKSFINFLCSINKDNGELLNYTREDSVTFKYITDINMRPSLLIHNNLEDEVDFDDFNDTIFKLIEENILKYLQGKSIIS